MFTPTLPTLPDPSQDVQPEPTTSMGAMLRGSAPSIVGSNTATLKQGGRSEFDATREAIRTAGLGQKPKGHPNRHKNLGKFLHPKKS